MKNCKKNPNNGDIKSVLKSIKQSTRITQELKTEEKRSLFNIKSVRIEHPETITTSSNHKTTKNYYSKTKKKKKRKRKFIQSQKSLIVPYS